MRAFRKLPTLVIETAKGKVFLVRASQNGSAVNLQIRPRPQPPYYPFHPADEGYEPPENWPLASIETADFLSDRFAVALARQNLPFVGPAGAGDACTELRDYLEERVKLPVYTPNRKAIATGIDAFVSRNFAEADCYLRFRHRFDALKWQLWTATERKVALSREEQIARASQRGWMYSYLRQVAIARHPANDPPDADELKRESKRLDREVFNNPLSPFFDDPMSDEEFEAFRKHVMSDNTPQFPRSQIFFGAVYARSAGLKRRWPPGFATRGVHMHGSQDFDFGGPTDEGEVRWRTDPQAGSRPSLFDVATSNAIAAPARLDKQATEAWLREAKQGDLEFDPATGRLIAVRGARLTTLAETEWYASDRVPLAELRKRLAAAPLESFTLPAPLTAGSGARTSWRSSCRHSRKPGCGRCRPLC